MSLHEPLEQNHKPQYMLLAGLKKWLLVLVRLAPREGVRSPAG